MEEKAELLLATKMPGNKKQPKNKQKQPNDNQKQANNTNY